jgi:uncharacterized membrane protein YfcA
MVTVLLLGALAILLATFLGGVVGFAYGLVALPLLLLLGVPLPEVVVINLLVGLTTRLAVVARRHADIDRKRAALLILGSLPGIGIGLVVRDLVSVQTLQVGAGAFTILAVAALVLRPSSPGAGGDRRKTAFTAGGLGGFLGVTTSLNGIPPALMLTGSGATARNQVADLAAYFVVGNTLTLLALGASGHVPAPTMWPMLATWLPVGLLGNVIGISLGHRLPKLVFRRLTLVVILVSGALSTIQAL